MQVLVALYRTKGGVVSRDALIAGHWPDFCADPDFLTTARRGKSAQWPAIVRGYELLVWTKIRVRLVGAAAILALTPAPRWHRKVSSRSCVLDPPSGGRH